MLIFLSLVLLCQFLKFLNHRFLPMSCNSPKARITWSCLKNTTFFFQYFESIIEKSCFKFYRRSHLSTSFLIYQCSEDKKNLLFNITYFYQSIFWIFIYFLNISIFNLLLALSRLFNNCIKLYWYQISSSWNTKQGKGFKLPPVQKKIP